MKKRVSYWHAHKCVFSNEKIETDFLKSGGKGALDDPQKTDIFVKMITLLPFLPFFIICICPILSKSGDNCRIAFTLNQSRRRCECDNIIICHDVWCWFRHRNMKYKYNYTYIDILLFRSILFCSILFCSIDSSYVVLL